MTPALRAAVIGANWGAVHVHAMRAVGIEVVALAGRDPARARAAAGALGVPRAVTQLHELDGMGLDLIGVATPASSHETVIAALPSSVAVVCEKPAVGIEPARGQLIARPAPTWVNYALPFLPTADVLARALAGTNVAAAEVVSYHDLPGSLSAPQWFFELAVHPWAWVCGLLGEPTGARGVPGQPGAIDADCGGLPVRVSAVSQPGMGGITHEVHLRGADGQTLAGLRGQYRIGGQWEFSAWLPTRPLAASPELAPHEPGDPWFWANVAVIAAVAEVVRGGPADPRLTPWQVAVNRDVLAQMALAGSWGTSSAG